MLVPYERDHHCWTGRVKLVITSQGQRVKMRCPPVQSGQVGFPITFQHSGSQQLVLLMSTQFEAIWLFSIEQNILFTVSTFVERE